MPVGKKASFVEDLPYALKEQVASYVRSVKQSMADIFAETSIPYDQVLADELLFLASIKKLYAICSGNFWAIDNSLSILSRHDATAIRIGGTFLAMDSEDYRGFRTLLTELDRYLTERGLIERVTNPFYSDILRAMADERQ